MKHDNCTGSFATKVSCPLVPTLLRGNAYQTTITAEDIHEAMLSVAAPNEDDLLNQSMSVGVNLPEMMGKLAQHYLRRALEKSNGNKTEAAELVGLASIRRFPTG